MLAQEIKSLTTDKGEKKVEYIELIYDLIFVYIIGRNNSVLHTIKDGFIDPWAMLSYVLTALVILQIWYYTTLFVNRYGENDPIMHISIFVNMYLLYFLAEGVRADWHEQYAMFAAAWMLILINLAVMHLLTLRKLDPGKPWERMYITNNVVTFAVQTAIIGASIPVYLLTGLPLAPLAMVFGIVMAIVRTPVSKLVPVDFPHLTERIMLYVVFTFGEMIIAVSGYFEGGFSVQTVYFSLFAFLIVVGLFTSYGYLYDHILDRNALTAGTGYMMLHVFLIVALNCITVGLELMRESEIKSFEKTLFMTVSIAAYFIFFFIIARYSRRELRPDRRVTLLFIADIAVFVTLMLLFRENGYVNIAVSLLFVASVYVLMSLHRKKCTKRNPKKLDSAA